MGKCLDVMPRNVKRLVMLFADAAMLPLALWAAFALRVGEPLPPVGEHWWLFVVVPALSLPVFAALGFYRMIVRYMGPHAVFALLKGVTVSTLILSAAALLIGRFGFPRSVLPLYWLLALLGIGGSRFLVRAYIQSKARRMGEKRPVIIYGAGRAGVQLANALLAGRECHPIALIDDDRTLHGSVAAGTRVYSPDRLADLIAEYDVRHVLLALPSASRSQRRAVLQRLERYPVHVRTIPGLTDIVAGRAKLDEFREVDIADLLGRDPVEPDRELLHACVRGKSVMVTGAGGSIGGELCRQLVRLEPRRLVLYERSEYALYEIERDLRALVDKEGGEVELVPLLGDVLDETRVEEAVRLYGVKTLYHAAAYKHVPIVEDNMTEGVRNNVLGTLHTALAARKVGVETFVLVSTDKAVRPTNVMGASKRLAELVLQGLAREGGGTVFCMVRFGNVLGSSGSVVPLFREQIRQGGPVTVTHPDVTRYFMTIPEAAALVIQAGAMARGGDVFVLDMGEPVRIVDLARKMIHLCGLQVRDEDNPDGDIEIRFTGLRPGEKLYEELLIGDNVTGTAHPMILRAEESSLPWAKVRGVLEKLERDCRRFDCAGVRRLLVETVQGYVPNDELRDLVWVSRQDAAGGAAQVTPLPVNR